MRRNKTIAQQKDKFVRKLVTTTKDVTMEQVNALLIEKFGEGMGADRIKRIRQKKNPKRPEPPRSWKKSKEALETQLVLPFTTEVSQDFTKQKLVVKPGDFDEAIRQMARDEVNRVVASAIKRILAGYISG